jgi:Protein of unknown function (DUF3175)
MLAMENPMAARHKTATRKTAPGKRRTPARKTGARRGSPRRWSQRVTRESDAMDLEKGVFKQTSAKKIAASLKRSAERSSRRKSGAYRSALSMLTFSINRPGSTLPKTERGWSAGEKECWSSQLVSTIDCVVMGPGSRFACPGRQRREPATPRGYSP